MWGLIGAIITGIVAYYSAEFALNVLEYFPVLGFFLFVIAIMKLFK